MTARMTDRPISIVTSATHAAMEAARDVVESSGGTVLWIFVTMQITKVSSQPTAGASASGSMLSDDWSTRQSQLFDMALAAVAQIGKAMGLDVDVIHAGAGQA